MVKPKASWKGLDRKYLLSSDPYKNIYIVFMTHKHMPYGHMLLLYEVAYSI